MKGCKREGWDPYVMDVQSFYNIPLHLEKKWYGKGIVFIVQIFVQVQLNLQTCILCNTLIEKIPIVHG
jgi:hypothetical protein